MSKRTEKMIERLYDVVFKKVFNSKRLSQASKGQSQNVASAVFQLQASTQYDEFCKRYAKKLAVAGLAQQKGLWKKYYNAAKEKHLGILPDTYKKYQLQLLEEAVRHNFKMIKSIPQHVLSVYEQEAVTSVINQIAKGTAGRKSFEKVLKQHGAKNAKLIARTEAAKLQTSIDENRATSLGSVCYQWISSKDRRTRQSHKAMNGVIVFWQSDDKKPLLDNMRGNAGEFPNCRCTTIAILDERDLSATSYKVYDYNSDKIVNMSRLMLIDFIKKGGL